VADLDGNPEIALPDILLKFTKFTILKTRAMGLLLESGRSSQFFPPEKRASKQKGIHPAFILPYKVKSKYK
jgi:hypothetical protein